MKKFLLWTGIGILLLLTIVVVIVDLFLDKAIKTGVETLGPKYTKVEITLESASLSLLSGGGSIKGLVVGNPEGYQTPHAITVGSASLAVKPASLLSDKIVVRYIYVKGPEITLEGNLSGNNLKTILNNVQSTTGGTGTNAPAKPKTEAGPEKPGKKLEVDDFVISDAKVHLSWKGSGKVSTVPLPDITLSNLGTGPEGITPGELTQRVLKAIEQKALEAAATGDLTRTAEGVVNDLGKSVGGGVSNVTKSIDDLLKKK
jgi:uncharacterized protein involved in outer membrane biogenesis